MGNEVGRRSAPTAGNGRPMNFTDVGEVAGAAELLVYEHGWQSWSPTGTYPAHVTSPRPASRERQVLGFRPEKRFPRSGFQGEGLLAVAPRGGGASQIWSATDPAVEVASIRARLVDGRLVVSADGPVSETAVTAPDLETALAGWAGGYGHLHAGSGVGSIPPVWCSWYQYFAGVTAPDIRENLGAAGQLEAPSGSSSSTTASPTMSGTGSAPRLASAARSPPSPPRSARPGGAPDLDRAAAGRRAQPRRRRASGMAGRGSRRRLELGAAAARPRRHPSRRGGSPPGRLPPSALLGLRLLQARLPLCGRAAGAAPPDASPLAAYREALRLIRGAVGPRATLLGCGAPLLPSLGLVDAMRVGPDVATHYEPAPGGDLSAPSGRGAALTVRLGRSSTAASGSTTPTA